MSFRELKEVDPISSTAVHVDACFFTGGLGATVAVLRLAVHVYKACKYHCAKFYFLFYLQQCNLQGKTNDSVVTD